MTRKLSTDYAVKHSRGGYQAGAEWTRFRPFGSVREIIRIAVLKMLKVKLEQSCSSLQSELEDIWILLAQKCTGARFCSGQTIAIFLDE